MALNEAVVFRGSVTSPRLGVVRESMLTNPLLIKARVGQIGSRGLYVPGPDFTCGAGSTQGNGGVAEVLSGWRVQSQQQSSAPRQPRTPDFVALNRDAVRCGLVTAKQLKEYRAQRAKQDPDPKVQRVRTSQHPAIPDITFGINTTRSASPFFDLLSHEYGRRWREDIMKRSRDGERFKRGQCGFPIETRTSLLRRSARFPHANTQVQCGSFEDSRTTSVRRSTRLPHSNKQSVYTQVTHTKDDSFAFYHCSFFTKMVLPQPPFHLVLQLLSNKVHRY
ncbi:cilia- and flagella-associated protein 77 isoform X1 [Entelurus aequoreus]|uniref:cilia- and flagella-associated protein 77 isoform X1 n=1 Tax=Entelurus aequoreus TaxID=161455 RepID=UPI002B1D8679|nr:cilia- and flagella-associated protein 77 isoform X1 [Entelurus aequoreus]